MIRKGERAKEERNLSGDFAKSIWDFMGSQNQYCNLLCDSLRRVQCSCSCLNGCFCGESLLATFFPFLCTNLEMLAVLPQGS